MIWFELMAPNDDEGHSFGMFRSPALPRVGDMITLGGQEATGKPGFEGDLVITKVTAVEFTIDTDRAGQDHALAEPDIRVWIEEEHAPMKIHCTCTDEERARPLERAPATQDPPGGCFNCSKARP